MIKSLLRKVKYSYGAFRTCSKLMAALFCLAATPSVSQTPAVLMLGDSLTQGYGLLEQDGLVPQLRRWLEDKGISARVINGGVSGDTTAGGLERFEWSLTPDVGAVVVALGSNDMLRGIDPAITKSNLDQILQIAVENDLEIMLVGAEAALNYGPDYKANFDQLFPDLAQKYDVLYVKSYFYPLLEQVADISKLSEFLQSDGMHPNERGVAQIVAFVGPKVVELITQIP